MVTHYDYGPTLCLILMVYFDDTFHDTVSEAVVTNFELVLYMKKYSLENLVVHTINLLILLTLWATQWSQTLY